MASAGDQLWGPGGTQPTFAYLCGPAGSGKTFLARQWTEETPGVELTATTGIAAINLGGTTIHSLLSYFDTKSLEEKYLNGYLRSTLGRLWRSGVRQIVLDEVSMLGAEQLTYLKRAIEEVNTKDYVLASRAEQEYNAEHGVPQMKLLLVGDFAQLSPVKEPYAFESPEWPEFEQHMIRLTTIHRQADAGFIQALRAARTGDAATVVDYFGAGLQREVDDRFEGTTLFAKNESVDRYNRLRLDRVQGKPMTFVNQREGEQRSEWGNPKKPSETWGIPPQLALKVGALVMILANRRSPADEGGGYMYVNGDLGIVVDAEGGECLVKLHRTGAVVSVRPVCRERLLPLDSGRRKELRESGQADRIAEDGKSEITGWIRYLPLRLAFGSTVHKSQGLSLDAVQISLGDHFFKSPGMVYVALSRCRTATGLRLIGSSRMLAERCTVNPKLVGRFL